MPMIHFVKDRPPIEVQPGATVMEALLAAGLPVASSCLGDGVCGKCRVQVLAGADNLDPESDLERRRREQLRYSREQRLSCQVRPRGDVTLDASYW